LELISALGANVLRVYHPPPRWFLELLTAHNLKVMVDIPWPKHLCVFESRASLQLARDIVERAIIEAAGNPAVLAWSVANEIPSDIVRYSGKKVVAGFIEELIELGRAVDPQCLFTYSNYPPTQYLQPRS
jgi:beta-galactosidase/beta-glucuronidase